MRIGGDRGEVGGIRRNSGWGVRKNSEGIAGYIRECGGIMRIRVG